MTLPRPSKTQRPRTSFHTRLPNLLSHANSSPNSHQTTQAKPHKKHKTLHNPIKTKNRHQKPNKTVLTIKKKKERAEVTLKTLHSNKEENYRETQKKTANTK